MMMFAVLIVTGAVLASVILIDDDWWFQCLVLGIVRQSLDTVQYWERKRSKTTSEYGKDDVVYLRRSPVCGVEGKYVQVRVDSLPFTL